MAPTFTASDVEKDMYETWLKHDLFGAQPDRATAFSMVMPPPNVTGVLHVGHALTVAVEDSLVRWRRMCGDDAVWVPGLDHAGIATQSVVERHLAKTDGTTRHDLGRDAFVRAVHEWSDAHAQRIETQLGMMGCATDWGRKYFTLDAPRSASVRDAFVTLHRRGLVYRDNRLVHWCPHLNTALADIEVDTVVVDARTELAVPGRARTVEVGTIHDIAYPVAGGGEVIVSTTRPETLLGDAAVAVHPDDTRHAALHGKHVVHPVHGTQLPIVLDAELVDMELGSGAVKVTPAHDANDFACAQRHGLPIVNILDDDGSLNAHAGAAFAGEDRLVARARVIAMLREAGLYRGQRDHSMRLGVCSRSGDLIEPMLKPQWYVRCGDMAQRALGLVEDGALELVPASYEREWRQWLGAPQDWCVSRQLWWGHRIPAYRVVWPECAEAHDEWIVAASEADAQRECAERFPGWAGTLVQDSDVLDTWFSSALLPMSAWRDADALARYYPLDVMETGADILFFWVARMVMLCAELHPGREPPFRQVLLHPVVRDSQGRKMSKSLGNVVDPLHLVHGVSLDTLLADLRRGNLPAHEVERAAAALRADYPNGIPACGTDAVRACLLSWASKGRFVNMSVPEMEAAARFGNKLWNAVRFALLHDADAVPPAEGAPADLGERWVMSRLARAVEATHHAYAARRFDVAVETPMRFVQDELCAVFMEWAKPALRAGGAEGESARRALYTAVSTSLKMLHPSMPFITDALWAQLRTEDHMQFLLQEEFPQPDTFAAFVCESTEADMAVLLDAARVVRAARNDAKLGRKHALTVTIHGDRAVEAHIAEHAADFARMAGEMHVRVLPADAPRDTAAHRIADGRAWVHVEEPVVEAAAAGARAVSSKKVARVRTKIERFERSLASGQLPDHVRAAHEKQLTALRAQLQRMEA